MKSLQPLLYLCLLLLTQCSSPVSVSGEGRSGTLQRMGYVPLRLEKMSGDVRFSKVFAVNGSPMRLLIDSGANSTDIDSGLAEKAGIQPLKAVSVVSRGALGRELRGGYGQGTLQAGPVFASNFPFTLSPGNDRQTATSRYAGQLGLDGLNGMGALVDIPGSLMWVPGPGSARARAGQGHRLGPVRGLGVKLLPLSTAGRLPHLVLEGTVEGRFTSWVIDTGAEVSVMAETTFRQLGLPSVESDARIIDAAGDRIGIRLATLRNVRFGEVRMGSFEVAVAPLDQVRSVFRDSRGRPIDGIIGMDFLTSSQALLDSKSGILYIGIGG